MKNPLRWRTALEAIAAVAAAVLVHRFLPFADDDPFRTTLVILPLVVAALEAIERHAVRRGALVAKSRGSAVVFGTLVLLTLGRQSLGLAATDWFLAAGFLLLLARRVACLLLLLRLGLRKASRPSPAFFFLPLVVYLALQPWSAQNRQVDGDEPFYLLLAHSLAYDFDADLANNYARKDSGAFLDRPLEPQPGDPRGTDGEIYSRHNLLLPLVLAPAYRLAGRWGAMAVMAVLAAALAWMVLRLAARYGGPPGAALLVYGIFAFSPPLLVYSYQVWIEVPAALLVCVGLDRLHALKGGEGRGAAVGLAAALVALPLLKLRLALVAVPLLVLAACRVRAPRRFQLAVAGSLAASLVGLLVHNQLRYGNLLKIHHWGELDLYSSSLKDFARGLFGMFYDVAFGLFPAAPIWLLLLPAGWLLVRRRAALAVDVLVVAGPYLLTVAPRFEWYGGWSPPFRYPLVVLPLFALMLLPLFELRHRAGLRALVAGLAAVTVVLALVWVVIPGWTYNFADGRTHLLERAGVRLGADVARLFPSTIRPRPASWIWPPLTLLLIPLALWRGPRALRRAAGPWGLVGVLVATAALPVAASRFSTRVIEPEDAWVRKERGRPFPELWVLQRPRYPSGWVIPPRGRVTAPVVAGGRSVRVRLTVHATKETPVRLRLAAGENELAAVEVVGAEWRHLDLGPFDWPAGEPLVLSGPPGNKGEGHVAVDRVELDWR